MDAVPRQSIGKCLRIGALGQPEQRRATDDLAVRRDQQLIEAPTVACEPFARVIQPRVIGQRRRGDRKRRA